MHAEALPSSVPSRERFARLRERLRMADIRHLRAVYFASEREVLVTLTATPKDSRTSPLDLDDRVKGVLLKLFLAWMGISQRGWNDGPDSGGVLDWNLRANTFTHKHCGYRLVPFQTIHRG
jgi:hypothetical protein